MVAAQEMGDVAAALRRLDDMPVQVEEGPVAKTSAVQTVEPAQKSVADVVLAAVVAPDNAVQFAVGTAVRRERCCD